MTDHTDGTSHRFFPFESKTAFEPFTLPSTVLNVVSTEDYEVLAKVAREGFYTRQEYVLMTCNCGVSIKSKVGEV